MRRKRILGGAAAEALFRGGLLGGLIAVELAKERLGITANDYNLIAFLRLAGLSTGRLGCIFSGLKVATYGTTSTLPRGINFGDGITRHPTNLYEILFLAALALLLWLLEPRVPLADGRRFER